MPSNAPLSVTVDKMPVGRRMWQSNNYGGLTSSPIKIHIDDPVPVGRVKSLAMAMTSFDPQERPSAERVLQELDDIIGECKLL